MGYDWLISMGVDKYDPYVTDDLIENMIANAKIIYKKFVMDDEHYPILGSVMHTSSGFYHKSDKKLLTNILKFTSHFPQVTFAVVYSSFDLTNVKFWKIKGDTILASDVFITEKIRLPSGNTIHITPKFVTSGNEESWDDIFDDINRENHWL